MEEKERYEIIVNKKNFIEIQDTESTADTFITEDNIEDLLNQCDKRIKELEQGLKTRQGRINFLGEKNKGLLKLIGKLYKYLFPDGRVVTSEKCIDDAISQIKENRQLKDQARKVYQEGLLQKQFDKDMEIQELKDKIETLKQSQKQLAIEELEKLREYIVLNDEYDEEIGCNIIKTFDLIEDLADKIKSLKGEE